MTVYLYFCLALSGTHTRAVTTEERPHVKHPRYVIVHVPSPRAVVGLSQILDILVEFSMGSARDYSLWYFL